MDGVARKGSGVVIASITAPQLPSTSLLYVPATAFAASILACASVIKATAALVANRDAPKRYTKASMQLAELVAAASTRRAPAIPGTGASHAATSALVGLITSAVATEPATAQQESATARSAWQVHFVILFVWEAEKTHAPATAFVERPTANVPASKTLSTATLPECDARRASQDSAPRSAPATAMLGTLERQLEPIAAVWPELEAPHAISPAL